MLNPGRGEFSPLKGERLVGITGKKERPVYVIETPVKKRLQWSASSGRSRTGRKSEESRSNDDSEPRVGGIELPIASLRDLKRTGINQPTSDIEDDIESTVEHPSFVNNTPPSDKPTRTQARTVHYRFS